METRIVNANYLALAKVNSVQPNLRRLQSPPLIEDSLSLIERGLKWARENPEVVAATGLGIFAFGVYLSARKANKAN